MSTGGTDTVGQVGVGLQLNWKNSVIMSVALVGCPGDDGGGGGEDTSSGPGTGVADGSSSGAGPGTAATGSDSDSSGSGSSTGGPSGARATILLRADLETAALPELFVFRYEQGQLEGPVKASGEVSAQGVQGHTVSATERFVAYRTSSAADGARTYLVDVEAGVPGAASQLNVAPAPSGEVATLPEFLPDDAGAVFLAAVATDGTGAAFFRSAIVDGTPSAPQAIAAPDPGQSLLSSASVNHEGTALAYSTTPTGGSGPENLFLASIASPDPAGAVQLSDLTIEGQGVGTGVFVPGDVAVLYTRSLSPTDVRDLFIVDLTGATPGTPTLVNDPFAAPAVLRRVRVAPDASGLNYWVGENFSGDLFYAALDGATPSAPVLLNTLGGGEALSNDHSWSPDSRWIAYAAQHEQLDTFDIYLVDMQGGPSAPMLVSELLPDGNADAIRFDSASQTLYYIAQQDAEAPSLYRVDVSGDTPGPAELLSDVTTLLSGELILSHDETKVMYTARDELDGEQLLYLVDLGGASPSPPTLVNGPPAPNSSVRFGARFSHDDQVVIYRERAGLDEPSPAWLVEVATPGEAIQIAANAESITTLPD